MTTITGMASASALVAVHLPFDAIVGGLMRELDLTRTEATTAAIAAYIERDEVEGARHARA
jgi:hypothetical protein